MSTKVIYFKIPLGMFLAFKKKFRLDRLGFHEYIVPLIQIRKGYLTAIEIISIYLY